MTVVPMSIALLCSEGDAKTGAPPAHEAELLCAVLTVPSRHRFIVYPDTKPVRALVNECGAAHRVTFVKSVKKTRIHRRVWGRAKRLVRRRPRPLMSALVTDALMTAGADCAWMLGSMMVPVDLPYVATIRDLRHRVQPWFPEASAKGEWRERDRVHEEFVRRASLVLVGTNAGAREVTDAYAPAPGSTTIVPLPTPSWAIEASERPRQARSSDLPSRYLLYPARFAAHKNHITAVRVLAAMAGMAAQPALVLVGADAGTKAHVMREAEVLGVASRVLAPGVVERERLISLYQNAEAMIHPSLGGPDNLPPLEAMALGCPVIAANVSGAEEQIGDAGMLVDAMDPAAYVAAIRSLRHDQLRRESLVERGMLRARGWTMPQYAAAVLQLIETRIAPIRALW